MTRRSILCVLAIALAGTAARAHHSPVGVFLTDQRTVVEGELLTIVYRTPHSYLEVRGTDERQRLRVWAVEWGDHRSVRQLVEEGGLHPGDRVIVTGNPSRDDGEGRVRLRTLLRPASGWRWQVVVR